MDSPKRPFASGSRQAPDPFDQYLEREGFYRKHVARDATCLFRTFSEQIFDVQLYHGKVRQDCVRWMRIKSDEYRKKISGDFDDYLNEISKPRSYGSFVELNALAHAYRRNVLLFEPYNVGTWFVKDDTYSKTVMVFFSPDKHFDSIFSTSYIQQAAYCQALVYEILYVQVFKLPDVMYSVERMLHDSEGQVIKAWDETDQAIDRIVTLEGRQFVFDIADNTDCVLDNYLLCHFHNTDNFDSVIDTYRNKKHGHDCKENHNVKINGIKGIRELINPMLCDKNISCVRQLLKEGITPFPYKVAKALDPNIYRNIEFDSWSDVRRELKYRNWFFEHNCLQVGAKCLVRLNDSDEHYLYGYIQEMKPDNGPCVVYVEDITECRTVPYDRLKPMPIDQTRSCKFRRSSTVQHVKITCSNHSKKKTNVRVIDANDTKMKAPENEIYQYYTPCYDADKSYCYALNNITNLNHFQAAHMEVVVMPFSVENSKQNLNTNKNDAVDNNDKSNGHNEQTDLEMTLHSSSGVYDMSGSSSLSYGNHPYCYGYPEQFPFNPVTSSALCALPYNAQQVTFASQGPYPGTFYGTPYQLTAPFGDFLTDCRATSDEVPNFQAALSAAPNGSDLPLDDLTTLRYFYNLGVEYFRHNQFRLEPPTAISTDIDGNMNDESGVKELVDEFNNGMNLHASIVYDAHNKHIGENIQINRRKYSSKNPRNKHTDSRGKQRNPAPTSTPSREIRQIDPPITTEHAFYDSQTLPYTPSPVMSPTQQFPVRVPCYAVDPSLYMVPSYGHSFLAPPPDLMLFHENSQPTALHSQVEAQYSPVILASPQVGTGFAIMGFPNTFHNCAENGNNDVEQ